ncbi:hypothetical protein GOBAR_DD04890 [Gossypium barbadense]|nr:hypothetical protein GOBAR_DD04890 [Gossypium barbadense]
MASTTATARAVVFSRITTLSAKPLPPSLSRFFRNRHNRPFSALTVSCLNSGGVCDDDYFVSTQKSNLDRGLLVIANMLKNIEPLDNSVVSKGKNLFFLFRYTLWNAEYRVSLMRNLERAAPGEEVAGETEEAIRQRQGEVFEEKREERASQSDGFQEFEKIRPRVSGELSPEALKYIEKLQAELSDAVEELNVEKENVQIECEKENRNDLLEYLRSLDADMVTELSQPSSVQVQETIHQLVQNILQRPFKNELKRDSGIVNKGNNHQDVADETSGTVGTSRDYLAKLLFWYIFLQVYAIRSSFERLGEQIATKLCRRIIIETAGEGVILPGLLEVECKIQSQARIKVVNYIYKPVEL